MQNVSKTIFRQYDIRGIYGEDLHDETAELLGKAFGTFLKKDGRNKAVVGRDNRNSSPQLASRLISGLLSTGVDVIDIGLVVSPIFYFATIHYGIDSGIMVTASHNPSQYNGFKVQYGGSTIYGNQLLELRDIMEGGDFIKGNGSLEERSPVEAYYQTITQKISLGSRKLKVVVDAGNGTAGLFAPELLRRLGCEVIPLYCDSDPAFPNHFPDPVKPENLRDLSERVIKEKADLGIGFDGDGDRIGVVTDSGEILWGDMLMVLFWREILPKYPGADAIVEVKCSQVLVDEIKRLGGKPFFYKTGHSLIKAKMKEIGALFTGEMSGHMFFADEYYGYDDALYAAARLLRILSHTTKSLGELLADVPRLHSTPELRVACPEDKKFAYVEQAKKYFQSRGYSIIDIDGARVEIEDGWGLVRASNTGPELIVRCEAGAASGLEKVKEEIRAAIYPLELPPVN